MAKKKARKAPKRRRTTASKPARRRSSSRSRKGLSVKNVMGALVPIALGAAGYIGAGYIANKVLANQSPKMRAGILTGGGAVLGLAMPSLAPLALGMGVQGAVQLAGQFFPTLTAPAAINGPSDEDVRLLAELATMNGAGQYINGADQFINGPGYGGGDDGILDRANV